jgi:sulfur relay (sulfurtransferase) complex TusBCD TusD component (DsrE family)
MTHFVFVESRDPHDSADCQTLQELAGALAGRGHHVTLFLVQNAVLPARAGSRFSSQLTGLASQGVRVLADDFALRERAIAECARGVSAASFDDLARLIMEPDTRALWH